MTIAAAVVAVLVLGVVAVMMMRKSGTDTATETVAYTPTPPPTSTSIPAPIGPTPEEAFQDHYAKAQAFIQQANKASARGNTAALAALPDDPRGVARARPSMRCPRPVPQHRRRILRMEQPSWNDSGETCGTAARDLEGVGEAGRAGKSAPLERRTHGASSRKAGRRWPIGSSMRQSARFSQR